MPSRGVAKARQVNRDVSEGRHQEKAQRAGHWPLCLEERKKVELDRQPGGRWGH